MHLSKPTAGGADRRERRVADPVHAGRHEPNDAHVRSGHAGRHEPRSARVMSQKKPGRVVRMWLAEGLDRAIGSESYALDRERMGASVPPSVSLF